MTNFDKISNERLQYNIYREATKLSALSSGKIDKYVYLTHEEILEETHVAITYQNERLVALTIKGDHKDNH